VWGSAPITAYKPCVCKLGYITELLCVWSLFWGKLQTDSVELH